jgi:hypothetical protein
MAILFLRTTHWFGVWPETGAAAQVPTYVVGPLVAGVAAWSAAASDRYGLSEQLHGARVHHAVSEAYRLGATTLLLLVPYLICQAVAFGITARTMPPGLGLWAGYALHGGFVTLLTVALGWTAGKLTRSVFAALASTFACLILVGVASRWLPLSVVTGPPELMVDVTSAVVRTVSVLALLVALLWIPVTSGSRRWAIVLPALGFAVIGMVMAATTVTVQRPEPGDNVTCVNGRTQLCIWPEHRKYVPMIRSINSRVDALPRAFRLPPRMNEFAIEQNWHMEDGPHGPIMYEDGPAAPSFHVLEGSVWSSAGDVATGVMSTTFEFTNGAKCHWYPTPEADNARILALGAWLESYLAGGGRVDYHDNAPAEMRAAFSTGRAMAADHPLVDQFSWAEHEVNDLHGRYCKG